MGRYVAGIGNFWLRTLSCCLFGLLLFSKVWAAEEPYTGAINGSAVVAGASFHVTDEKFVNISAWNTIDGASSRTPENILELKFDYFNNVFFFSQKFTINVTVNIKCYNNPYDTSAIFQEYNNVLLTIRHDSTTGLAYKGLHSYKFNGAYKYKVTVLSITSPELGSSIPNILKLEGRTLIKRKYNFNATTNNPVQITEQARRIYLSWIPAHYPGAELFDLEYTIIDDSSAYGKQIQSTISASNLFTTNFLAGLFKNNSTRITTPNDSVLINPVYRGGFLVFRIRGVQFRNEYLPNLTDAEKYLRTAGNWNYSASKVGAPSYTYNIVDLSWHEDSLNWQYSVSFAEEGKKKEMVGYYDGLFKNRQNVTINNATLNAIVQETFYDAQGRPAVNVLPAPTNDGTLHYFDAFNRSNLNKPYNYSDISAGVNCNDTAALVSDSSGAGRYYSEKNDVNDYFFKKYIPKAEGYPYSFTSYTQDNTGRIKAQGGVGKVFQPGQGHDTKYFYGKPTQDELDRLFGVEAGNAIHYLKNMVVDPNGQISVSYVNASGKTVATALAGVTPPGMEKLPSHDNVGTPVKKGMLTSQDFTDEISGGLKIGVSSFLAPISGEYKFFYDLTPLRMDVLYGSALQYKICNTCYYDLEILIKDNCGVVKSSVLKPVLAGTLFQTSCSYIAPVISDSFAFNIAAHEIGDYSISYNIKVSEAALAFYDSVHLAQNTDIRTFNNFLTERLGQASFIDCFSDCKTCIETLGTQTEFINNRIKPLFYQADSLNFAPFQSWAEALYTTLYNNCQSIQSGCQEFSSPCDEEKLLLLEDLMPGGQYALYDENFALLETSALNVLQDYYRLGRTFTNEDGTPGTIFKDGINHAAGSSSITTREFIENFKPAWAEAFLPLHPEYCFYQWCLTNSTSKAFDNMILELDNDSTATAQGYFGSVTSLLASDPFFGSGGYGSGMYYDMYDSLYNYSNTVYGYPSSAPVKNILSYVDFELYCEPNGVSPSSCVPPGSTCRSPYMEWQMYKEAYLRLKSYFVEKARIQYNPECKNCYIGTDNTEVGGCTPPSLSWFTATTDSVANNNTYIKYKFNNAGDTTAPNQYVITVQYVRNGVTYYNSVVFPAQASSVTGQLYNITSYAMVSVMCDTGIIFTMRPEQKKSMENWWKRFEPDSSGMFYASLASSGKQTSVGAWKIDPKFIALPEQKGCAFDCPCPTAGDFEYYNQYYSYECGYGSSIFIYYNGPTIPFGREVTVYFYYTDQYCQMAQGSVIFSPGETYKEYCLGDYFCTEGSVFITDIYCYDDPYNFICPSLSKPPSLCTDDSRYAYFKNKIRRYNDYQNTTGLAETIRSRYNAYADEQKSAATEDCKSICEAQADTWINALKGCNAASPAVWTALRNSLINACKSGCSPYYPSVNGTSDSFESIIRSYFPTSTDSCTAYLISNPYPSNKEPQYNRTIHVEITTCLQDRFTYLKNKYLSSGFSGSFHLWLQRQLGADYKLKESELTSLETQLSSGCKYFKKPIELPVAMGCKSPSYYYNEACRDSAYIRGVWNAFNAQFPGVDTLSQHYQTILTNYFNHYLGYALNFEDYDAYIKRMLSGTLYKDLLCSRSQDSYAESFSDVNNCLADVFLAAYSTALTEYNLYIDSVRAAFRAAYFTRCLAADANLAMRSNYLEYHYTLYYYDQSGNLVKTIPPAGVTMATPTQIDQTINYRKSYNRYCQENQPFAQFTGTNRINVVAAAGNDFPLTGPAFTFTMESFVRLNNFSNQPIFSFINYSITGGVTRESGLALMVRSGKLVIGSGVWTSSATNNFNEKESPAITNFMETGKWYHVAVVFSAFSSAWPKVYVNGVPVPLTSLDANSTSFYNLYPTSTTMLGGSVYKGVTTHMQGGMRQFRMYRRALSQLELLQNATNKCLNITNQASLLANVPLNEGTGNTAKDLSANFTASVNSGSLGWGNYFPPYYPTHTLPTVYEYNSLNQVVMQSSPDGDTSRFWYDVLGRLVASQNKEQLSPKNTTSNSVVNRYSYTTYDAQGRITEVGEKHGGGILRFGDGPGSGFNTKSTNSLALWYATGSDHQVTQTYYDIPATAVVTNTDITTPQALNSRKRVVSSLYKEAKANTDYDVGTHYVYDINGNVKTLFQEHKAFIQLLPTLSRTPRRVDYEYDLISGKVNKVHFQKDKNDRFSHKYEYDAENRLTSVWTSKDEHGFTWENDARYYYYLHGPLARSEIGDHEVQGLDFAYTLQGWLKGINGQTLDPAKDMGEDGLLSNPVYKNFSRDVMAFSLGYHNNDYKPIGNSTATAFGLTFTAPTGLAGTSGNSGYELFNGNIRNTTLALNKLNSGATSGYSYLYDQLNRITATKQHNISGTSWSFSSFNEAYRERTTYDANGNIMRYLRQGANVSGMPLGMDSLTYNYYAGSNKLSFVRDAIAAGNYTGDVDIDNQSAANYDYDKIGNLMGDVQGGLSNISWNVYGKIRSITKTNGTTINYKYDPSGNRIEKSVTSGGVTTRDFYIRDAQGNILSVYRHAGGILKLEEMHLYGSSRLGLTELKRTVAEETIPLYPVHDSSLIGWKRYELSNHLGNVLAVISDKKTGVAGSGSSIGYYTAEVISDQEYYPFGMGMPGRRWSVGGYAYGFNGKENDNEVKGMGNQQDYGMRIYDPRLGKFLSVDPLTGSYPWLTPYQYSSNNPIYNIDLDGLEGMSGFLKRDLERLEQGWNRTISRINRWVSRNKNDVKEGVSKTITSTVDVYSIIALVKTAQKIDPNVQKYTEEQKMQQFATNSRSSVAILLYEFATGSGKASRNFYYSEINTNAFSNQVIEGRVLNEIVQDLYSTIVNDVFSYQDHLASKIPYTFGLEFSPDHTETITESVEKHLNSNLAQLFIGGANISIVPVDGTSVDVTITNYTSRKSLLLHKGKNYDLEGDKNDKRTPLSTIKQVIKFRIINLDKNKTIGTSSKIPNDES